MNTNEIFSIYTWLNTCNKIHVKKDTQYLELKDTVQCEKISQQCEYPEDFQKFLLFSCQNNGTRWANTFTKLMSDDMNVPWKTIKKGIISVIFNQNPEDRKKYVDIELGTDPISEKEQSIYEQYFCNTDSINTVRMSKLLIGCMGASNSHSLGFFTRTSIHSWLSGAVPRERNIVIRLAFWAHCTVEETNKLLECAGMHKLYIKGTGRSIESNRASLQDIVYIFMLEHENYSFTTAQEIIEVLNKHFHKKIKEKMTFNPDDSDTFYMQDLFNGLSNNKEDLIEYFDNTIPALLYSYKTLYGNIVESFINKYSISKGSQADPVHSSIHAFTTSQLEAKLPKTIKKGSPKKKRNRNSDDGTWRESLKNTLYAAFNMYEDDEKTMSVVFQNDKDPEITKQFKEDQTDRIFQRNDIIALGLILHSSKAEINNLLEWAQEAPLYSRNFAENVVMNATENPAGYCSASKVIDTLFTAEHIKQYSISSKELLDAMHAYLHFYSNPLKYKDEIDHFGAEINALLSLRKYEWIKSISVVREIYPTKRKIEIPFLFITEKERTERHTESFKEPRSQNSIFIIKCMLKHLPKKKEFQEKVIKKSFIDPKTGKKTTHFILICHLKKLKVVRPIAYRYSKKLLSYYPEKTLFDFLVERTAGYLKDKDLGSCLKGD